MPPKRPYSAENPPPPKKKRRATRQSTPVISPFGDDPSHTNSPSIPSSYLEAERNTQPLAPPSNLMVNIGTAKADASWRGLHDHNAIAGVRELQAEAELTVWQPTADRDGDSQRPNDWKLYDPAVLPLITSYSFHDSAGVNGYPANVYLGDRALISIMNARVSIRARADRWPADFTSQGKIQVKRIPRGQPALSPQGQLLMVLNSSFQPVVLSGSL